ncbi:MAG: hypothetical protein J07AB43_07420 [Candidatus Nanosalina sp. J07AB43]|nr:MAG: hypothetical protein J07AB43_07420 [Candidatus Nanosalina sp. J07AB43]
MAGANMNNQKFQDSMQTIFGEAEEAGQEAIQSMQNDKQAGQEVEKAESMDHQAEKAM